MRKAKPNRARKRQFVFILVCVRAEESAEAEKVIKIKTEVDGYNSGRIFACDFLRSRGPAWSEQGTKLY
jgi:hypothetical protein